MSLSQMTLPTLQLDQLIPNLTENKVMSDEHANQQVPAFFTDSSLKFGAESEARQADRHDTRIPKGWKKVRYFEPTCYKAKLVPRCLAETASKAFKDVKQSCTRFNISPSEHRIPGKDTLHSNLQGVRCGVSFMPLITAS